MYSNERTGLPVSSGSSTAGGSELEFGFTSDNGDEWQYSDPEGDEEFWSTVHSKGADFDTATLLHVKPPQQDKKRRWAEEVGPRQQEDDLKRQALIPEERSRREPVDAWKRKERADKHEKKSGARLFFKSADRHDSLFAAGSDKGYVPSDKIDLNTTASDHAFETVERSSGLLQTQFCNLVSNWICDVFIESLTKPSASAFQRFKLQHLVKSYDYKALLHELPNLYVFVKGMKADVLKTSTQKVMKRLDIQNIYQALLLHAYSLLHGVASTFSHDPFEFGPDIVIQAFFEKFVADCHSHALTEVKLDGGTDSYGKAFLEKASKITPRIHPDHHKNFVSYLQNYGKRHTELVFQQMLSFVFDTFRSVLYTQYRKDRPVHGGAGGDTSEVEMGGRYRRRHRSKRGRSHCRR